MNPKTILLNQIKQINQLLLIYFPDKKALDSKHGSILSKSVTAGNELTIFFSLGWQPLLLPLGLFDLMFILSLFWVNLESSNNLNFHMGTCFCWMMSSANTFFPHNIHFKTLIKEIPEEHQTCLAYHCLCLQNFGSSNLQLSSSDRKQDSAVWAWRLSIWPCREALH